jgi:glycosyltransferase involved in cell wall biosynthesis
MMSIMNKIDPQSESFFRDLRQKEAFPMAGLAQVVEAFAKKSGPQAAFNLLLRCEVAAGGRKPSLAVYDHTLHLIGGGEKYGCTLAQALQDDFDVTLIGHQPVTTGDLMRWYDLDLSRCRVKIMPLEFFASKNQGRIDPDLVSARTANPFFAVSRESGNYDFFVNNSMMEMVYPLANISLFVCHFPERQKGAYFYVPHYRHLIVNSRYTATWVENKWGLSPSHHIYPPVDMEPAAGEIPLKEKVILAVARFESGGSKQQLEMISAFARLRAEAPEAMRDWKLILCGGSIDANPYLDNVRAVLEARPALPVQLQVNIPLAELKAWYGRAAIFWHFCGLGQSNPARVEHFGMSTVEAMQNGCLPIVFDGGGQREIVENGITGFRFSSARELREQTLRAIADPELRQRIVRAARLRGADFNRAVFSARVRDLFQELADGYAAGKPLTGTIPAAK